MSNGHWNLGPLTPMELAEYETQDLAEERDRVLGEPGKSLAEATRQENILATQKYDPAVEAEKWRRVAEGKWKHYRDNVLPSGNPVAIAQWEHSLLKCIPFLIGRLDLEITIEDEERIHRDRSHIEVSAGEPREDRFDTNDDPHPLTGQSGLVVDEPHRKVYIGEGYQVGPQGQIVRKNDDPHRTTPPAYPAASLDFGDDGRDETRPIPEPDCG